MGSAMKSNQTAVAGGIATTPGGGAEGLGRSGLGASGGQRLPSAPRERKPALAALAVLLILGGALTSAYLVMASGQRVAAIRIAQPVAAGQRIPLSALEEVQVSDTGADYYINWTARGDVARAYAAVPLVQGALLTNQMVSRTDDAAKGRLVVGLALKPGQFPSRGLQTGKRVSLYAVGGGNGGGPRAGTVLSADAIVVGVSHGGDRQRLRGDQTTVDVAVPPGEAPQVTQAASAGSIAIALIPDGTRVQGGQPQQPATGPERRTPQDGSPVPGTTENPGQNGGQTPGQTPGQNGGQNGGQTGQGGARVPTGTGGD
ncbi:hypothetical protein GCM10023085_75060 [Actinomadura viridis]|uniref:SAF domain-containing protein n=1 Tax=Actinomadura viridis TaxID=58110 RepID=A0A931D8X5_9ACTN|nr:hypothetical protein [Actinomadura viridis]MBG6086609.1 hypothetical protein [Actinomadura viridis]